MRNLFAAVVCTAFAACAFAQTPAQLGAFPEHWKTAAAYTIAIAEQMPAESYSFKPVPEEMSFAEQLVHIAQANNFMIGTVAGQKPPMQKPLSLDKENVLKFLHESFDWTSALVAKFTPEQVQKSYQMEGHAMAGADVLGLAWNHTTHHRGQLIVYLRLKGIKPVDYEY